MMAGFRSFLHVGLALILLSLTCDLGAVCAFAGLGGDCCCPVEAGSHCDVKGGDDSPFGGSPEAAIDSSERFCVAVLEPSSAAATVRSSELSGRGSLTRPAASSTPLYLSHCAFLC